VKYYLYAVERPLDIRAIDEISFNKLHSIAQPRDILAVPRAEIIKHAHLFAAIDERLRDVRANEAGAASNEIDSHRTPL
jgi:hypothetical protein